MMRVALASLWLSAVPASSPPHQSESVLAFGAPGKGL